MDTVKARLQDAEEKAAQLFRAVEDGGLISPGKSEKEINTAIFKLAYDLFGIEKYWHKRIVRSGANTLQPYNENPPDLIVQQDDILFLDFGPIFEEWEADFGRTYVLGDDPVKHKLKNDIETAWHEGKAWFGTKTALTGAEYYQYVAGLASHYGWTYGGEIAGHLIGQFPHEKIAGDKVTLYIHPDSHLPMHSFDEKGRKRHWILEIHFVDREREIGGFYEELLTVG